MRALLVLLAACASMPSVNGDTLGEPGSASLALSPDEAKAGALVPAQFTLTNSGDGASGVLGARITGADAGLFAVGNSSCSVLQPGDSCTINVRYFGLKANVGVDATLEIDEAGQAGPTAKLDAGDGSTTGGGGIAIIADNSTTLVDTTCRHGFSPARAITFEVINSTGQNLTNLAAAPIAGLAITGCSGTVAPGKMCQLSVAFAQDAQPVAVTAGTLSVTGTAGGMAQSATATFHYAMSTCLIDVAPDPIEVIGAVGAQVPTTATATITNTDGAHGVVLAAGALAPAPTVPFTASDVDCPGTVVAGGSCRYAFAFTPQDAGSTYVGEFQVTATSTTTSAVMETASVRVAGGTTQNGLRFDHALYDWGPVLVADNASATLEAITLTATQATGQITLTIPSPWKEASGNNPCADGLDAGGSCTFQIYLQTSGATLGPIHAAIAAKGAATGSASAVLSALLQ